MTILFFLSLYKPYTRGGAEVIASSIIDTLKKDHTITVITCGPWKGLRSLMPRKSHEDGVTVYRFFPLNFFSFIDILSQPTWLRFFWHIIDTFHIHTYITARFLLRRVRPDVVMTHNSKGLGYTLPLAVQHEQLSLVHTVHDLQLATPRGIILLGEEKNFEQSNLLTHLYAFFCRTLFASPKLVVFPSHFLKEFFNERGFFPHSKKIVLPNPVPFLKKMEEKNKEKKDDIVRFLCVSQLEPHKGIRFLLNVFMAWRESNVELVFVGRGSLEKEVQEVARCDARVRFLGYVENKKLLELFREMDYCVMPSLYYENAPLVVVEALAGGLPVLVSDIGGAAELIEDEVNGYRFTPNNEESLRDILKKAVARKGESAFSKNAQKSVSHLTLENYTEKLLEEGMRNDGEH